MKTIKAGMDGKSMKKMFKKGAKWTQAQDDAYDKKHGLVEGSKADIKQDKLHGIKDKKKRKKLSMRGIKKSGKFQGKSNKLGFGGRAAQLKARGVPGGVIGNLARAAGAAKGGPNYHGK